MSGLSALRRLSTGDTSTGPGREPAEGATPEERCEFCGEPIAERHGHVADLTDHRLLCVCRPCYLLFAPQGAGGGRYRGVGEEVRRLADPVVTASAWDALRVPVDLAFFFRQDGRLLGFYPGPGGATESELDLSAWATITAANPVLDTLEPDVEAVLLRHTSGQGPGADREGWQIHLVPVDLCYELVGAVRRHWIGLGGGAEVWAVIDAWFAALDERAREVTRG